MNTRDNLHLIKSLLLSKKDLNRKKKTIIFFGKRIEKSQNIYLKILKANLFFLSSNIYIYIINKFRIYIKYIVNIISFKHFFITCVEII